MSACNGFTMAFLNALVKYFSNVLLSMSHTANILPTCTKAL